MTENVIIAFVAAVGAVVGAIIQQVASAFNARLDAYRLAQQMQADNARLWQWNRSLVDHIYKGLGPPPPDPPENLFETTERRT